MIITKGTTSDLDQIMTIVDEGKAWLKSQHVNQWQDGYPNRDTFINDIDLDRLYVIKENDEALAVFAITDYEPTYDKIYEGSWLKDNDYIAVHRIAVSNKHKGKGIAAFMFNELKKKYKHIKVDTHEQNQNMNKCLLKNGISYRGIIYLAPNAESDNKRVAYEYLAND